MLRAVGGNVRQVAGEPGRANPAWLGLDEFSMNPPVVPLVKQILRGLNAEEMKKRLKALLLKPQEIRLCRTDPVYRGIGWIRINSYIKRGFNTALSVNWLNAIQTITIIGKRSFLPAVD